jgi:hypothetical protein
MNDFTEVITNAQTGEVTTRPYTAAEIAAHDAESIPSRQRQEEARRAAYQVEADPIFFMAQRGEATMSDWTAKVAEIKARFPYPVE